MKEKEIKAFDAGYYAGVALTSGLVCLTGFALDVYEMKFLGFIWCGVFFAYYLYLCKIKKGN